MFPSKIEGDLTMCALNRLVNGKTNNFYEKVFELYKEGGWPCGWKGTYPKGEFIVFVVGCSTKTLFFMLKPVGSDRLNFVVIHLPLYTLTHCQH